MDGVEDFLERDYGHNRGNQVLSVRATHYWRRNSECHLLTRSDDLRPADHNATTIHSGQDFTHALVHLLVLNDIRLKSAMHRSIYRPDGQADQVRIFFQCFLQTRVVTCVIKRLDAAGNFKSPRETGNHIAIALAIEFDLSGFVLYELRLITSFY